MSLKNLDILFNPQRIAVIGASEDTNSVGYHIFRNLIGKGFKGIVHPVAPHTTGVQGVEAYRSIKHIPHSIDLALVATGPENLQTVLKDCGEKGVKGLAILTPDYIPYAKNSELILEQIRRLPSRYGCRVLGPNSLGFMKPEIKLNASLFPEMVQPGNIAFITESGIFSTAFLEHAIKNRVGFSYFISLGTKLDINFADTVDFLAGDGRTRALFLYIETILNGRKFMTSIRNYARNIPIVVVKPGKANDFSCLAINTHDSLSEEDLIYDAVFKRSGSLRVSSIVDLLSMVETIAKQHRPKGKRLLIISNSIAPSKMAADTLKEMGGHLAEPSEGTLDTINKSLSIKRDLRNPIYLLANAAAADFQISIESCLQDKNVDGVLVICIPFPGIDVQKIAKAIVAAAKTNPRTPLFSTWFWEKTASAEIDFLNENGIPTYYTTLQAVKSFIYMYRYDYNLKLLQETPETIIKDFSPDQESAEKIIKGCSNQKRVTLLSEETLDILRAYGIPVVETIQVDNEEDAVTAAKRLGYPVVVKNVPGIVPSQSKNKVILSLNTNKELVEAFSLLHTDATIEPDSPPAILIQPMILKTGFQLTVGARKSVSFGTVILFGLGGVHLEAESDYSIGLPPLNQILARRMMEETKIFRYLQTCTNYKNGLRSLEEMLIRFSQLIVDLPQIETINIDPLLITEQEVVVRDAIIYLDTKLPQKYQWKRGDLCPLHLSIPPYPFRYEKQTELKDGTKILIRPIRGEDEPLLRDFFESLSAESVYLRFGLRRINVPHDILARLCQVDYDRDFAFIAVLKEKEDIVIGDVRLNKFADLDTAEFSFVVADKWQSHGVGAILMDYCIAVAKEIGLKSIHMEVLKKNTRMIDFGYKYHFERIPSSQDDDMEAMQLTLTE